MGAARLPDAVRAFFADHRLPAGPGVAAVSGGADSVALLRALAETGAGPLHVGYFHHHLRETEAEAEREFVARLTLTVGGTFHLGEADVRAAGGNLEATARRLRYEWLTAVAEQTRAVWVATGHTADDQAETVFHRLLRGTGLRGLRGIATTAAMAGTETLLIRPLLAVTRGGVLAYLAGLGQPYCTDSSNADPRFTRNRLRAEVLPLLRSFNPDVAAALARAADQAGEAFALIDRLAVDLLASAERPRAGELVILDAATLTAADPLLAREAFRRLWEREGWPTGPFRAEHWHRLVDVTNGDPPAADFPGGVSARRAGRVVRVGRRS